MEKKNLKTCFNIKQTQTSEIFSNQQSKDGDIYKSNFFPEKILRAFFASSLGNQQNNQRTI